ncbi:MAG: hypothetical protein AB7L41_05800 [Flavobacteriaceae bacterium]
MNAMAEKAPMLVFIHVPKTAGGSLRQWLIKSFDGSVLIQGRPRPERSTGIEGISWGNFGDLKADVADFSDLLKMHGPAAVSRYRVIGGHIDSNHPLILGMERQKLFCAVLRDPVERAISRYAFVRRKNKPQNEFMAGLTLYQALQTKRFRSSIENRQLRFIFGDQKAFPGWTILAKFDSLDLLTQRLSEIYGLEALPVPFQTSKITEKAFVYEQPDFLKAVNLLRKLNKKEIAFINAMDGVKEMHCPDTFLPNRR